MEDRVRYFEELEVGDAYETPGRTITQADVVRFAAISGDHASLGPGRREPGLPPAIPELLVVAVTSGLGFRAPVPQPQILAFLVVDWRSVAPVRIGDTLRCRVRITAKRALRDGGVIVE